MGKRFLRIKSKAFILPSLITATSLFFGFLATLKAFNHSYRAAAMFILLSVVADNLDGLAARKLHATSEFGKNLDSLSDLIAFGMAPAIMLYTWGLQNMADEFGIIIAFIYLACGAMRLARFNTGITDPNIPKNCFQGLPIPGAAGIIVILCYIHPEPLTNNNHVAILMAVSLLVSWLMVSSIPYPTDKNFSFRQANRGVIGFLFLAFCLTLAFICYSPKITLAVGFIGYGLSGLILKLWLSYRKRRSVTL